MAFKKMIKETKSYNSPSEIFRDLTRRKLPDVLPHQDEIMRSYAAVADKYSDIALQLPTGSGKTLVGLLIAEWRRRKGEKIVYLCPTKQLAHQVAEQATEKYGLSVALLIGSQKDFNPSESTAYKQADKIAITTYSGLFNSNPFFKDADVILLDDAHAAENYISSQWSVFIDRYNHEHSSCYNALCSLIKPFLDHITITKLMDDEQADKNWTDMLPVTIKCEIEQDLINVLDTYTKNIDLRYSWELIKSNLDACQIFLSSIGILIRPLIPPTFTHLPFSNAKQRIYMSATLGNGGDLERLTGRKNIHKVPTVNSLNTQGVGRRFFMFPEMSLDGNELKILRDNLLNLVNKSVFLVPNYKIAEEIRNNLDNSIDKFDANDIEKTKLDFKQSSKASAILANRYDGIDFPGDECRLLFIEGLPKATNLQEKFLMSQMGAHILYNERIQTRIIQDIGRCTRSLEDYSAVVITGEDLPDYLTNQKFITYLQPELQAEIQFGINQSKDVSKDDFLDNFEIFIKNDQDWEEAYQQIIELRENAKQNKLPCLDNLSDISKFEIEFQESLWQKDYLKASDIAATIIGKLTHNDLRGYRALWNYLAGYVEYLEYLSSQNNSIKAKAIQHFKESHKSAPYVQWLTKLQKLELDGVSISEDNINLQLLLQSQISGIALCLERLGTSHNRKYDKIEMEIREGLKKPETFEEAQKQLGKLLGFNAGNQESQGAPDPWWICENRCIVFEDYINTTKDQSLCITKTRQAASHPNWIRENCFKDCSDAVITPVVVSPIQQINSEATIYAQNLFFWSQEDFLRRSEIALSTIRELRQTFNLGGDLDWRVQASRILQDQKIDFLSIEQMVRNNPINKVLSNS